MNWGSHCVAAALTTTTKLRRTWNKKIVRRRKGGLILLLFSLSHSFTHAEKRRNDGWIKLIENIVANDMTRAHLFLAFKTNSFTLSTPAKATAETHGGIVEAWKIRLERRELIMNY